MLFRRSCDNSRASDWSGSRRECSGWWLVEPAARGLLPRQHRDGAAVVTEWSRLHDGGHWRKLRYRSRNTQRWHLGGHVIVPKRKRYTRLITIKERKGNILFNDALSTFYLWLYGVRHMVKDHSDSEKGNPVPPHGLLFPINSKGSFICTIPQTGLHIPQPFLHQSWSTGCNEK